MKKKRINQPITVTISPESQEAVEVLKEELSIKQVSPIIDTVIKEAMTSRGYTLKDKKMLVDTNPITVEIVHGGETLTKYAHDGQNFVKAPASGSYVIRLKNNTGLRKLVVISVDGRNIMDGEIASPDGSGYVLSPFQTWDIKGWRRTSEEVASFEFVDLKASYDKQVGGSGKNVGVIGVAVFDEAQKFEYWYGQVRSVLNSPLIYPDNTIIIGDTADATNYSCEINGGIKIQDTLHRETIESSDNSFGATTSSTVDSRMSGRGFRRLTKESAPVTVGTGYGKREEMRTISTSFDKASSEPSYTVILRYASEPMLKKWGVIREPVIPTVNPFPAEKVAVKPPPNWKG